MSKEARLAMARERVRAWKKAHPRSLKWQKERWYQRKKEARRKARPEVEFGLMGLEQRVVVRWEAGETRIEPLEGVDVPYEEYRIREARRQAYQRGVTGVGGAGPVQETANEAETYRRLGELRDRQARGELNAGVEVELEL